MWLHHWILHSIREIYVISIIRDSDQNILNHGFYGLKDQQGFNTEQCHNMYVLHHWILHSIREIFGIRLIRDADKNILNHRLNRLKDQHGFKTEQCHNLHVASSLNFAFNPWNLCNQYNPWCWLKYSESRIKRIKGSTRI